MEKLPCDWVIWQNELDFSCASPRVSLSRLSAGRDRSQGCLQIMRVFLGDAHVQMKSCFKEHQGHPPEEQVMTKGQCTDWGPWQTIKGAVPAALIWWQVGKIIGVTGFGFNNWMIPLPPKLWASVITLIHSVLEMTLNGKFLGKEYRNGII